MILALKTASDSAEIYIIDNSTASSELAVIEERKWETGRTLARDLLGEIEKLVDDFSKLTGIIVFSGPGSFTGLRIGVTTANAIAYTEKIPIVGADGDDWLTDGAKKLADGQNDKIVLPEYGAPPHITAPRK